MISFTAYAKHRDISHQAVYKARKAGRLAGAIITVKGKEALSSIEDADREWNANTDQSKPRNSVTGQPKREKATAEQPYASDDSGHIGHATNGSAAPAPSGPARDETYSQSRAMRERYAALDQKMSHDLKAGALLDAEVMRKAVFDSQREARDMLLALPDRVAPLVLGELDPNVVHRVILDEVRRVCAAMCKINLSGKAKA
jgi:hypothetical protein